MKAISLASTSKKDIELALNRIVNEINLLESKLVPNPLTVDPRAFNNSVNMKK